MDKEERRNEGEMAFALKKKTPSRTICSTRRRGGGGWIRTTEAKRNRFTVCPLWPLGNSSEYEIMWSWWTDSNPRPADYKSAALPAELHQHLRPLSNSKQYCNREMRVCQGRSFPFLKNLLFIFLSRPGVWPLPRGRGQRAKAAPLTHI